MTTTTVIAAVIERDERILVTRRVQGTHLAGYWEFPGGKLEPGESHGQCLVREIQEELDVVAKVGSHLHSTTHAYVERTIELHFYRASITSEPRAVLGQRVRWVTSRELAALRLPPADDELVEVLTRSTSEDSPLIGGT